MLWAYAAATSCVPGECLRFRIGDPDRPVPVGSVTVDDAVSGQVVLETPVHGPDWALDIPDTWRSSLYRAVFAPGDGADAEVWFVVRPAPATHQRILLSVPFATWQAYNRSGVPGEGLYWAEDPLRAKQVSFDRPGGGPPPERWEEGLMHWLRAAGIEVDYCSNLDLHLDPGLLSAYLSPPTAVALRPPPAATGSRPRCSSPTAGTGAAQRRGAVRYDIPAPGPRPLVHDAS